jgi:hypothetical protein
MIDRALIWVLGIWIKAPALPFPGDFLSVIQWLAAALALLECFMILKYCQY